MRAGGPICRQRLNSARLEDLFGGWEQLAQSAQDPAFGAEDSIGGDSQTLAHDLGRQSLGGEELEGLKCPRLDFAADLVETMLHDGVAPLLFPDLLHAVVVADRGEEIGAIGLA